MLPGDPFPSRPTKLNYHQLFLSLGYWHGAIMNPNLIEKLRCYIEFNEDEERFISSVFKLKHLAKGEHFLLAGDVCREAAFIESGVFRFYINTDERDPTYYF